LARVDDEENEVGFLAFGACTGDCEIIWVSRSVGVSLPLPPACPERSRGREGRLSSRWDSGSQREGEGDGGATFVRARRTAGQASRGTCVLLSWLLTGGVDEEEIGVVESALGFEDVAGGAADVGDDRFVAVEEMVEETRFPGVGATDDADAGTFTEDGPGGARPAQVVDLIGGRGEFIGEVAGLNNGHLVFGEIEREFGLREQFEQAFGDVRDAPGEFAGEFPDGETLFGVGAGADELENPLRRTIARADAPAAEETATMVSGRTLRSDRGDISEYGWLRFKTLSREGDGRDIGDVIRYYPSPRPSPPRGEGEKRRRFGHYLHATQ